MLYLGFNTLPRSVVRRPTGLAARITRTLYGSKLSQNNGDIMKQMIRCCGCQSIVSAQASACHNCGRCVNCGRQRSEPILACSNCKTPICECCGRCLNCNDAPVVKIGICECGHPDDPTKIKDLVDRHSAKERTKPVGSHFGTFLVLAVLIVIGAAVVYLVR